jgi:DNA-binding transcriptional regulator GbsR (MarR family)
MAQDRFMESIGRLCGNFGLNKFLAQLYAFLYLSDRPISLDEISERLQVSKGNVSINIRELENWGAVRKVWVKGSRKDYYEANLDIKKVIANKLRSSVQKRMVEISSMLDDFRSIIQSASGELTEEEKRIVAVYDERLKKIEDIKTLASNALSVAEKLLL